MRIISEALAHKLRAHSCHWSWLPLTSVPSAAVDDQQTQAWSKESYDRDLDEDRKANTRRALVLVGLGGLIAAAMVGTAVVAKADYAMWSPHLGCSAGLSITTEVLS